FGNDESARFGGNGKTADYPSTQFNGRKHNRRGHATGNQPPDLAPQTKRVECAGAECAGASARRKETHKINHAGRRRFHSESRPYLEVDQIAGWGKRSLALVSSLRMPHRDVELAGCETTERLLERMELAASPMPSRSRPRLPLGWVAPPRMFS